MVYRNIIFPTNLCIERNFRFRKNCLRIVYVEHAFPYFHFGCYFHPIPRISVVRTSPSPHDEGETRSKWDRRHSGLVATCAREKMPGAKLKSVSPAGMEGNGFTVARCFVRLWSLDAVVSATDASNCVASLFLEPRTDIPRRKRDQRFVDDEDGINFSR